MITTLSFVALGGAIGAAMRWLTGLAVLRMTGPGDFPLAIITANVVGSFLMGLFVVLSAHKGWGGWNPFVMTGLLGGFTTFSAFSLEAMTLIERGQIASGVMYITLSVALSLGGLALGLMVARGITA